MKLMVVADDCQDDSIVGKGQQVQDQKDHKEDESAKYPKMEKPSKVNSATAVKLGLGIENLGLKEMK